MEGRELETPIAIEVNGAGVFITFDPMVDPRGREENTLEEGAGGKPAANGKEPNGVSPLSFGCGAIVFGSLTPSFTHCAIVMSVSLRSEVADGCLSSWASGIDEWPPFLG